MGAGRAPLKKKGELGEGSRPCLDAFSSVIPAALGKLVSGSSGLLRNKVGRHPQPPILASPTRPLGPDLWPLPPVLERST